MRSPVAAACRRRRQVVVLALLVCAAAAQVSAQPAGDLHLVCLNRDGAAQPLPPLAAATPEAQAWQEIAALAGPDVDIQACWVWNEVCPPAKHLPGSDLVQGCGDAGTGPAVASEAKLVVRLLNLRDDTAGAPPPTVIGAPSAMWREVPRSLLPTWSAGASAVRGLPYGPGPWRVQACTERRCSRWTGIPDGTGEASLRLSDAQTVSYQMMSDGYPLENARFYLVRPGKGGLSQTEILGFEQADDEGRVAFRLPAEESSAVVVSSEGREAAAFPTLPDVPDRVELEAGFFLSGRIISAGGDPVAARLYGRSFIRGGFGLTQLQKGRTGADGRFRMSGFPLAPQP